MVCLSVVCIFDHHATAGNNAFFWEIVPCYLELDWPCDAPKHIPLCHIRQPLAGKSHG